MKNNEIEIKLNNFSNYLIEIGLLNSSYVNDFCKKFIEISKNGINSSGNEETDKNVELIYIKENFAKTIVEYYNSLSEERKNILALDIFSKYIEKIENKAKNNQNKEEKNIYAVEKMPPINILANIKVEDKENINKDINIINNNNNNNNFIRRTFNNINKKNKNSKKSQSNFNNSFITQKPQKFKLEKNKNNNNIKSEKSIEINQNCTFQPNTRNHNNSNSNNNDNTNSNISSKTITKHLSYNKNNNQSVFDRLNKISERKKKEIENIEKELNKENIFQPNKDKNNMKLLKRENFDERLKLFENEKKDKEQKRKENEQKLFQEKFTFK